MPKRVLIVGAGLGGSLLAIYLARAGMSVLVVERRGDPRAKNYVGGRSINLAISARGIHALERAGLANELLEHGIRMPGRMIHPVSGAAAFSALFERSKSRDQLGEPLGTEPLVASRRRRRSQRRVAIRSHVRRS
jgi:2-polyprenyl-6-methoxyphenol hydroxylase-like FAD-dependent oxidoreductase